MEYIKFSFFFILAYTLSYTIAGNIALFLSKDIYESKRIAICFLPAQILRGLYSCCITFYL